MLSVSTHLLFDQSVHGMRHTSWFSKGMKIRAPLYNSLKHLDHLVLNYIHMAASTLNYLTRTVRNINTWSYENTDIGEVYET